MPPGEQVNGLGPATAAAPASNPDQAGPSRETAKQERRASSYTGTQEQWKLYVRKVKQRFRDDPDTWRSFSDMFLSFKAGGFTFTAWERACRDLEALMGSLAPDLLADFMIFSPKAPEDPRMRPATPGPSRRPPDLHQGRQAVKQEPAVTPRVPRAVPSDGSRPGATESKVHRLQYNDFIRKIQTRFPGGAQAEKFRTLMGRDRSGLLSPALELRSRVHKLFTAAPELYQDYERMMGVFDQHRGIAISSRQSTSTPQSLERGKPKAPEIETELDPSPYATLVPSRSSAAATAGPVPEFDYASPGRWIRSLNFPNPFKREQQLEVKKEEKLEVKKEEQFDIKPFSAFGRDNHQTAHVTGSRPLDYDEDDVSSLMRTYYPENEELVRPQQEAHHDAFHLMNEEQVRYREAAREKLQRLLSLPDTEIPAAERMDTPRTMNCRLMPHQQCGLTWMVRQEDSKKGGLLADEMGLGKTVQALALILARPSTDPARKTTLVVTPVALLKQWEGEIQNKVRLTHKLSTHIYHGSSKRGLTLQRMLDCDVILTTYNTIVSEYKVKWRMTRPGSLPSHRPLLSSPKLVLLHRDADFHRVILDEAHTIRNRDALCSIAMSELRAKNRLCLTGTPFMNNTAEIFPLIRFLRIEPYNEWEMFNNEIRKPLSRWSGDELEVEDIHEQAMMKLQTVFRAITLRRTKASMLDDQPILRLPAITKLKVATEFDDQQASFYLGLEITQRSKLTKYMRTADRRELTMFIFVLLLRLRQACCHPHLIRDRDIPYGCSIGKHQMIKLALKLSADVVHRIHAAQEFRCLICVDRTELPVLISPCGHVLCASCFSGMMEVARPVVNDEDEEQAEEVMVPKCPECHNRVHADKVICYTYFKQAFESGLPAVLDDENDNSSAGEDDAGSDLSGFVVSDDESDDVVERDGDEEEDADMTDSDSDADVVEGRVKVKRDQSMPPSDSEDYRDPAIKPEASPSPVRDAGKRRHPRTRASGQLKAEHKPSDDSDVDMADIPTQRPRPSRPSRAAARPQPAAPSTGAAARKQYLETLRKEFVSSAKIDKAMAILRDIGPHKKTLIFSQWTSFLDLLEVAVMNAGCYKYTRYDGSMTRAERDDAVKAFQEDRRVKIMLVSLKAGNVGLNLTAAQHVLIMEPDWNPFIEDQAIDRAHRIGQKNEVTVHRLLIAGTVEDRILKLQERKRNLVQTALSEEGARGVATLTREELLGLFR